MVVDVDMSCHVCGCECRFGDDYFMVTDEVWFDEAGLEWDDFLCRSCLMSRLGRELVREDYTSAPVNWDILWNEFGVMPEDAGERYRHRSPTPEELERYKLRFAGVDQSR